MATGRGFTLAEVLITLGIIGIVAAMTIPTVATRITHKKLQSQFKKTYAELNQATRAFYADTDIPVHDYDVLIKAGVDTTSSNWDSNALLNKFMSYYKGFTKASNSVWSSFDKLHNIKNLNLNGIEVNSYPCDISVVYMDSVGRLYSMDDTSTAYASALPYGPKICVDINGIDRPNRWGYDRFVFVFTEENAVIPYTGTAWNILGKNLTDKKDIAKYCDKTQTSVQHACAYFALSDQSPTGNGSYWYDFLIRNK